jgi:TAT (twin-arginine translocation) pathway signal sequence
MVKVPTRRNFLVTAGAGAAALGAAVVVPEPAAAEVPPAGVSGPLVAYVTDMRRGELTLMLGEREVVVHDRDLAARLARAAH